MCGYAETCNGVNICYYDKKVFGTLRRIYYVEQFDTTLFHGTLEKCRKFCEEWANGTKEIFERK